MNHIPYENGWARKVIFDMADEEDKAMMAIYEKGKVHSVQEERPEDPIDEVIQTTEEAWEERDIYISGVRGKDHETV